MSTPTNLKEWKELLSKAEGGDKEAQYTVGLIFEEGLEQDGKELVDKNLEKAFEWHNKAAQNGSLYAETRVADFISEGISTEKNIDLAIDLYKNAISKGSSTAALNLATVFRDKGEFEKAFEYYLLYQEMSGYEYSLNLALCHYYGIGTLKDPKKALAIFKAISEDKKNCCTGDEIDEANFILGQIHLEGTMVDQSVEKARKYLELADIDGDHRSAQKILLIIGRN